MGLNDGGVISVGDTVKVDEKVAKVTGTWGQGKHRAFQLDDGRVAMDLKPEHRVAVKEEPKFRFSGRDGKPLFGEDHED
jgi:hypothetical protein